MAVWDSRQELAWLMSFLLLPWEQERVPYPAAKGRPG